MNCEVDSISAFPTVLFLTSFFVEFLAGSTIRTKTPILCYSIDGIFNTLLLCILFQTQMGRVSFFAILTGV